MIALLRRHTRLRTALLSGCALGVAALSHGAYADDGDVVARAGKTEIKVGQVKMLLDSLDPRQQTAIAGNPAALSQVVRQMLAQRVILQEALANKWDQRPEAVAQIERAKEIAIAESYITSVTRPPEDYPSDAELQAAYEANQTSFLIPRQFQLAQIFVALPRDADNAMEAAARVKLDRIQKRLKQRKPDFAAIAKEESDDKVTGAQGGQMPWLLETQITPEIRTLVQGMAKDAIADPVRLDDGWHVIKVIETKASYTKPLAEVRDQLVKQVRADRAQELRRDYMTRLMERNPAGINELELQKLLAGRAK